MNKYILFALAIILLPSLIFGQVYVHGYTRKDGTYVAPYMRSSPNGTTIDNYSTKGNIEVALI